ncbi:MAG: P-II family nitrogen regulator [Bacteroidia bacterium]
MIKLVPVKLVTIIALDALEQKIIKDIKACGSKGYTITEVEGEGLNGKHFTDWEGRNIRIDTLVKNEVAEKIMETLAEKYFEKYSIVAFVSTVEVLRKERFEN